MNAVVWLPPLVRALATALLVVSASAVAEALGPFWGALISSLPVSSGPAYVFLALRHGPDFIAASALSSFAANAATGLFLASYGLLVVRAPRWTALGAALLLWVAAALAIDAVAWTPLTAAVLNLAVYGVGFALLGTAPGMVRIAVPLAPRRWYELPARAVAVAGFVSFVVAVSSVLGPAATGIVAVFPISLLSLLIILRPRIGGAAASLLAANALRSMLGFGAMLLGLHLAIGWFGIAAALPLALSVSAGWSAALLLLNRRRR